MIKEGHCQVCGEPLLELVGSRTRYSHYCSRACRLVMAGFEEFTTLKFILLNSRWSGGEGFPTFEEKMAEAIEQLAIDEGPLAEVLIELVEASEYASR